MTRMKAMSLLVVVGALVAARPYAGGWAVVKVTDVPEAWVAGRPLELAWETRGHGTARIPDLHPRIEARAGDRRVVGTTSAAGRGYRGQVTLPSAGEWEVTVHGGFGNGATRLLPISVVDSGGPVRGTVTAHLASRGVRAASSWERGRRAFAARGCVTCHAHDEVPIRGDMAGFGPTLTGRQWPAQYLARFLANPAIGPGLDGKRMPDLDLSEADIALLVGFLNGEGRQAASR